MLSFNSFRSKRYLRTKFVEGKYLLASEATDLELEILDLIRSSLKGAVGNIFNNDGLKVEKLSDTQLLLRTGDGWYEGLPLSLRSGNDQLFSSGVIAGGASVVIADSTNGKSIDLTGSAADTYRIVLTVEEELIGVAEDPFLQNANITETTANKVRLVYKINVVEESKQNESPNPYKNDTNEQNLVNQIVISPILNNGDVVSVASVSGSEILDGRDIEITVNNNNSIFPTTPTDQQRFKHGKLIDARGALYHINEIFNGVGTTTVLRLDKEAPDTDQPNPDLTSSYTLVKADVYVTEDNSSNPRGKVFIPLATVAWDGSDIVHSSSITDLRNPTKSQKEFQDGSEYQSTFNMTGGGTLSYNPGDASLTWTAPFEINNSINGEVYTFDTPERIISFYGNGDSIIVPLDFTSGGTYGLGRLTVTATNVSSTVTLSGGPDLSQVSVGNSVADTSGNIRRVLSVNNVNKTLGLTSAFPGTGTLHIYRDVYSNGNAPQEDINNFVVGTFAQNPIGVYHKGHLLAGISTSNIRGSLNERDHERIGVLTDAVGDNQEDRSGFLRSDSPIIWNAFASQLTFNDDIILELLNTKNGILPTTHSVANGTYSPLTLNDGDKAYIQIDRTTDETGITLTVVNGALPAQTQSTKDLFVLFYRVGDKLHIPYHQDVMEDGQELLLGASGTQLSTAPPAIVASGTLSAGSTDISVGEDFDLNAYPSTQCGAVQLWIDGTLQLRNDSNSPTPGNGDYYELDAGGSLSNTLRMNFADTENRVYVVRGIQSTAAANSVIGPASSVDNAIVRWDSITGNAIQNSPYTTIDDNGNMTISRSRSGGLMGYSVLNTSDTASSDARILISTGGPSSGDAFILIQGPSSAVIGMDNSDSDIVKFTHSGSVDLEVALSYTASLDVNIPGGNLNIIRSSVGVDVRTNLENIDNTNNSSGAFQLIRVGGESAGDPYTLYSVSGAQDFSVGIDNSDGNQFKISSGGVPGTGDCLVINPSSSSATFSGSVRIPDGSIALPGLAFSSNADTGITRTTSNRIAFSSAGLQTAFIDQSVGFRLLIGQILAENGTSAAPTYSFDDWPNTGMHSATNGRMNFSSSGTDVLFMDSSGLTMNDGQILSLGGNASAPGISFRTDPNTGMFSNGVDQIGFSSGGSLIFRSDVSGLGMNVDGSAGSPSISWTSDTDTGIFRAGVDSISISTGGTTRLNVNASGSVTLGAAATTPTHQLNTLTNTSATAGANGDVPAQVDGYIELNINGVVKKIPYYNS